MSCHKLRSKNFGNFSQDLEIGYRVLGEGRGWKYPRREIFKKTPGEKYLRKPQERNI